MHDLEEAPFEFEVRVARPANLAMLLTRMLLGQPKGKEVHRAVLWTLGGDYVAAGELEGCRCARQRGRRWEGPVT